jgi:hypothetical protein
MQPSRKLIAVSILAAMAMSLLVMLGIVAATPSVETVTSSRGRLYRKHDAPLRAAYAIDKGQHADQVRTHGVVETLRALIAIENTEHPGLDLREEDSPGNFIIIEAPGIVTVRSFDHAGAPEEIVIPSQP